METAEAFVCMLAVYLGVGAVVGVLFLGVAVARLDASAKGASVFFRPMVFLGCVALWPFIIMRWLSGRRINQSTESDNETAA